MKEFILKIWKDPVGSAVIGAIIATYVVPQTISLIQGISLKEYYSKEITLTYGIIAIIFSVFIGTLVASILLFKANKRLYEANFKLKFARKEEVIPPSKSFSEMIMENVELETLKMEHQVEVEKLVEDYENEIKSLQKSMTPKVKTTEEIEKGYEELYQAFKQTKSFKYFDELVMAIMNGHAITGLPNDVRSYFQSQDFFIKEEKGFIDWKHQFTSLGKYIHKRFEAECNDLTRTEFNEIRLRREYNSIKYKAEFQFFVETVLHLDFDSYGKKLDRKKVDYLKAIGLLTNGYDGLELTVNGRTFYNWHIIEATEKVS